MNKTEYLQKLVRARLQALPPEVSFSIGEFGEFTRDELIREINDEHSEIGKAAIEMQLDFINRMPHILSAR